MSPLLLIAAAVTWIAPQDPQFTINGLPWLAENKGELIRLPRRLEPQIPAPVWNLGLSPSGGRIRFRTDSTRIAIRVEYPSPPNMSNMHAFGQTGIDVYIDGAYRSTAIAPKDAAKGKTVEHVYFEGLPKQNREITLYLPLYKPAIVIAIGLDDDAKTAAPLRFANLKPVVFYGTSITQGGCASRSGLSYQAILARQLNIDFVNLGFSGNGRGEPAVASMTAEIDASLFVLDFSQNNSTIESLSEAYEPFLKTVRDKHPRTPIVAITPIASSTNSPRFAEYRQHIREVINRHITNGDKLLTLVEGYSLLGPSQLDGLVDGVHPNDLGFQWMADGLAPVIADKLTLPPTVLVNDSQITVTSVPARRQQIINYIWGPVGMPTAKPAIRVTKAPSPIKTLKHARAIEAFEIKMEANQENTTYHFLPANRPTKLIILQHGHACTFDDEADPRGAGMAHSVDSFLEAGYGVLIAYMPHMRPGDCQTLPHAELFNLNLVTGSALKFFLEPVLISLNLLKPQYKEIHMAGLSGGGWTTTLIAAIEPAIRASFPIAGTIPLHLRTGGSVGDKEQYLPEFYSLAGYPDLYYLGAYGPGRKQVQILNRKDNCCFGEAQHKGPQHRVGYEAAMRDYERKVQQALAANGAFRLEIDDTAPRHMISPYAVQLILRELAK